MQPVCDLRHFPRLARADDESVMRGVHRRVTIVTDPDTRATSAVQPFPMLSQAACEAMLAPLHPTDAQRANLAVWFQTHPTLPVERVLVTMVRVATRYGQPLKRTSAKTCPLEQLFDVRDRSYVDTVNAVATVVACRGLDLGGAYRDSPSADEALHTMFQSVRSLGGSVRGASVPLNVFIAFILQPSWFDEFVAPTPLYAAHATGAPGLNVRSKSGKRARDEEDVEYEEKEERPSNVQRSGEQQPDAPNAAPKAVFRPFKNFSFHIQNHMLKFVGSDRDSLAFLQAMCYRTSSRRWDEYEIKETQDLLLFQHLRRRGIACNVILTDGHDFPIPYPVHVPKTVIHCTMTFAFNSRIVFDAGSRLKKFEMGSSYNHPFLLIPASTREVYMGDSFVFNASVRPKPGSRSTRFFAFEEDSQLERFVMGDAYNGPIRFPVSIKNLTLGYTFNSELEFDGPVALDEFTMGAKFNRPGFRIPGTVSTIVMGDHYNQVDFVVPRSTVRLTLGYDFNQPLQFEHATLPSVNAKRHVGVLDAGMNDGYAFSSSSSSSASSSFYENGKTPVLGKSGHTMDKVHFHGQAKANEPDLYRSKFSMPVAAAAASASSSEMPIVSVLRELVTGVLFNQPLHLPGTLEYINFGSGFNNTFVFDSPPTLEYLGLDHDFNRPGLVIPRNTEFVEMRGMYNQPDFVLPAGVAKFSMAEEFNHPFSVENPCILQELLLGDDFNVPGLIVPASVETLDLGIDFNQPFVFADNSRLHTFSMSDAFNHDVVLPPTVKKIIEGSNFESRITFLAPAQLDEYWMSSNFNELGFHVQKGTTVRAFFIGSEYNQSDLRIPEGTRELFFHDIWLSAFNQPLTLPNSVVKFTMNDQFNSRCTIEEGSQLEHLTMGKMFNQSGLVFPPTIKTIEVGPKFAKTYHIALPTGMITVVGSK